MAQGKTITIEIINNSTNGEEESTPAQEKQKAKTPAKRKNEAPVQKSSVSVLGMYAFNTAKNDLVSAVSSTLNRTISLNENYLAQNNLNVAKKSISLTTSLASSIGVGAKIGAVGGAVGSAIGAAIGAIGWGATQFVSYQNRMSSYYQQLNTNNFNTEFAQVRAGLINNNRGTEN